MAGLGVFLPLNKDAVCIVRQIALDSIWDADVTGELCAWSSASHPLVPTQLEIDNAETAIDTNPELCNIGETLLENTQGDSLIEVNSNGDLLLQGQTLASLGGDDLGSHVATQNLDLSAFDIDNIGGLNFNSAAPIGQALLSVGGGATAFGQYDYGNLTNLPTDFPPSPHTHVLADITDLSNTDDLIEGTTNLYFTDARVAASPQVVTNTSDIATLQASSHDPATGLDDSIVVGGTGQQINVNLDTTTGAGDNVLTLTPGEGLYVAPSIGDNLGDHTATQDLDMGDFEVINVDALRATAGNGLVVSSFNSGDYINSFSNEFSTMTLGSSPNNINLSLFDNALSYSVSQTISRAAFEFVFDTNTDWSLNGDPGTIGQVFTSNGNNQNPSWEFVDYGTLLNVPVSFPPAAHTHVLADITNLNDTGDLPEGTNLYFTDARVTASPQIVTNVADIAALQLQAHDPVTNVDNSIDVTGQVISVNLDNVTPDNSLTLTPGEGLYVPASANGFAVGAFARTDGAGNLIDGSNVTVTRTGVGTYAYTFLTPLPDADYSPIGQSIGLLNDANVRIDSIVTTGFNLTIGVGDNGGTLDVLTDGEHSVVVYSTAFSAPSTSVLSVNGQTGAVVVPTHDPATSLDDSITVGGTGQQIGVNLDGNTGGGDNTLVLTPGEGLYVPPAAGDDLGSHTATQDLDMANFAINNATAINSAGNLVINGANALTLLNTVGTNFSFISLGDGTVGLGVIAGSSPSINLDPDGVAINLAGTGDLSINGVVGTAGQSLTSQGDNTAPIWAFPDYNNLTNVPATFAPSPHTHVLADITNLNNTGDLPEGSNLYYTEARVSANADVAANTADRHVAATALDDSISVNGALQQIGVNIDGVTDDNTLQLTAGQGLYARYGLDYIDVAFAGQNDVNASVAGNILQLGGVNSNTIGTIDIGDDEISLPDGVFLSIVDISLTGNSPRTNQGIRLLNLGAPLYEKYLPAYIRDSNGHTETGFVFTRILTFPTAGTVSLEMFRIAAAGTVTLDPNRSSWQLIRIL